MRERLDRRRAIRFICAAVSAPVVTAIGAQSAGAAADTEGTARPAAMQGYGACASCNCPGFTGSYNTCGNCGHNYRTHW
ncbi:MAG: hypothetical protein JO055_11585 [Alphaproteobacteria bacterium]|nr:hypothetical protein [Alphaproteobacteria bacterium]